MKHLTLIAVLLITLPFASSLKADVAYSNFGAGDTYSSLGTGFGNLSSINASSTNYHLARGFTSQATGLLSSIELPVAVFPGLANTQPGIVSIGLWSHTPGVTAGKPGQLLWSGQTNLVENQAPDYQIYEVDADFNQPLLVNGTVYWVVASSLDGSTPFTWAQNNDPFNTGRFGFSHSDSLDWEGESFTTEMAFRVNVSAVPEPTGAAAMTCLSLLLIRRRRIAS